MENIVKMLAPFAASEKGKYNSPKEKLYCVWKMPTGVYVANHYMFIKVFIKSEDIECININLKCYEKFSVVPLRGGVVSNNFFSDSSILVKDENKGYNQNLLIFNKPPDFYSLLKENRRNDVTVITVINVINTLKNIPKGCKYVVINDTVFNAHFFTSILKLFKKLGDKYIDIVFRDEKYLSVEFVTNRAAAFLMPIYHLDILNDMEQKYKEDDNIVTYL